MLQKNNVPLQKIKGEDTLFMGMHYLSLHRDSFVAFEAFHTLAVSTWFNKLGVIFVQGGETQKKILFTYVPKFIHSHIHMKYTCN